MVLLQFEDLHGMKDLGYSERIRERLSDSGVDKTCVNRMQLSFCSVLGKQRYSPA
jgi:DNA-directed RNA polymerase subunit N (RpoN/RPB10)